MFIVLTVTLIIFCVYLYRSLTSTSEQLEVTYQEQIIHENDISIADFSINSITSFISHFNYMDLFGILHGNSQLAYYLLSFVFFTENDIISYFLENSPTIMNQYSLEKQFIYLDSLFIEMSKTFNVSPENADRLINFCYGILTKTPAVVELQLEDAVNETKCELNI